MIPLLATKARDFANVWPCRLALVGLITFAALSSAQAQIVALVNGEPITAVDIAQRTRLIQLSTQKVASRQEVLDELIEDKLKIVIAKRFITEVPKREIESSYSNIARRAGMSPAQFSEMMQKSGISVDALKSRIHSDFVWQQIIRGKFQASLQVGEKEVEVKLQGRNKEDPAGVEYRLRPILFLVARGGAAGGMEARKREAEALRGRFQSCEDGLRAAMALPDVAVREMITRQSTDLPQQQRDILNNTPVGRLTPPDVTFQGVEMFAMCGKGPSTGDTAGKREVRETMFQEKFQALSKKFMKEMRSQALIEIR